MPAGEVLARVFLIVLGLALLENVRRGTLGDWLRAKFLNSPLPEPPPSSVSGFAPGEVTASGRFLDPVPSGSLVSVWGDPRDDGRRSHQGIDLAAPCGTPVRAAAPGTAVRVGSGGLLCGKRVAVRHGDGTETLYCHLSGFAVRQGQAVAAGQPIGFVGKTGNAQSTGCHLHFEIRIGGRPIDPLPHVNR